MLTSTNRTDTRPFEVISSIFLKPLQFVAPTLATTPIDILAKSLIANTIYNFGKKNEIIDNNRIFELAKMYDQSNK
jgi:hypothetical protein